MTTYCSLVPSESSCSTREPRIRLSPVGATVGKAAACLARAALFSLLAGAGLAIAQTPFTGTPIAIPGTWEAENFDLGGEGVAYHDNTPGNQGGQYRTTEDVDIIVSMDSAGGGYVVNNFETGEWLNYTINVPTTGNYTIELRAVTNSGFPTSAYHVEIDGVNVTGSVVLPTTDSVGWSNFQWIGARTVTLAAGTHFLKLASDQQYFNLNQIRVTAAPTPTPFSGTPIAIPGTWEAENFDLGGEGVAYHDKTPGNQGGQYRTTEDVDIIVSMDSAGGGYVVNNFETGEWLNYTINVPTGGNYDIELRAVTNSGFPTSAYHVEIDGVNVTGSVVLPTTDSVGWSNFQWIGKRTVTLAAGTHFLKVVSDQQFFNLNSIRVLATPSSPSATLLFRSGFESSTALCAPGAPCNNNNNSCYGTGCWQDVVGTDSTTGFTWPPNVWGGGPTRFQMIADAQVDANSIGNYQVNRIDPVTGHNGSPTQALYSEITQSGCCGTGPQGDHPAQDAFTMQPLGETSDLYISYWIKYQPNLVQLLTNPQNTNPPPNPPPGGWRVLFEWKTGVNGDNGDYRITASLVTWGLGGPLSWHMTGDNVATSGPFTQQTYWEKYTTTDAQTVGTWMKFEVFWHRSRNYLDNSGRVWMAVNGQVIADISSATLGTFTCPVPPSPPNPPTCNTSMTGVNNAPINRIMMPNLYSSTSYPIFQWVDDLQIWNGFPPDAAPH